MALSSSSVQCAHDPEASPRGGIIRRVPLGLYISVPFCRTKCSYCNFASDVFSKAVFDRYLDRVCADIQNAERIAQEVGGHFEKEVDSIYFGGGTPTTLDPAQLERLFEGVRTQFSPQPDAEITVECAPGTLTPLVLDTLLRCGVNRVSLGVQSFVDQEAAAVGRLHKHATLIDDIARLRTAGITNLNIDLIAGLPHQTAESWHRSLAEATDTGVPHVSVYMLEVDDDSRLGRELIAGGTRYHAHFVPDDQAVADFYRPGGEVGGGAPTSHALLARHHRGVAFSSLNASKPIPPEEFLKKKFFTSPRAGFGQPQNLKYGPRQPYFGFGVDAHSMLRS